MVLETVMCTVQGYETEREAGENGKVRNEALVCPSSVHFLSR